MAVVKKSRNITKTLNKGIEYAINPQKTHGGQLVGSNYEVTRTDVRRLTEPMMNDNRHAPMGIRKNSRLAYHVILSFSPNDPVTPEQAHRLGMEFAHRITGDDYKFVVGTHTDRHHLHNHIIICAAAADGRHLKAELPKDIIEQWRVTANEICAREGLSVIFNPVTEQVARKMRDAETTMGNDAAAPARGHEPGADGSRQSTPEPSRTTRRDGGTEPLERRYGLSMEEIYAAAKGKGVKDRLRVMIDLTTAGAENFEDWKDMLDVAGVDVTVRGQHLTYTLKSTGFRIRDSKLGQAYDMTNIMAGLQSTPVIPITFNRRLVARRDRRTITIWLPGTKRQKKITFDAKRLIDDGGSTLRAFLPRDREQIILDRGNRYAGKTITYGLYQWFGEPTRRLEPLATPERLPVRVGVSPAQQRHYQRQAKRLDRLREETEALNTAIRWTRAAGGDTAKGIRMLRERIRDERAGLQAAVIALQDAIQQGDSDLIVETRNEMERREHACERYESQLAGIQKTSREHERTRAEERHKRGRLA